MATGPLRGNLSRAEVEALLAEPGTVACPMVDLAGGPQYVSWHVVKKTPSTSDGLEWPCSVTRVCHR